MLMKKKLHYLCYVCIVFITTPWLTTSCWSDLESVPPAALKPEFTTVLPETGDSGTVITITGVRFGTDATKVRVRFRSEERRVGKERGTRGRPRDEGKQGGEEGTPA